jgi:hypothetical protein
MNAIRITLYSMLGLVCVVLLAIFMQTLGFSLFKTFAPRYEQVRRETFEQSQAYNEGMRRDLESIHDDYLKATDPSVKAALRATFIHRAEGYPNQLPVDLQSFYANIK